VRHNLCPTLELGNTRNVTAAVRPQVAPGKRSSARSSSASRGCERLVNESGPNADANGGLAHAAINRQQLGGFVLSRRKIQGVVRLRPTQRARDIERSWVAGRGDDDADR